MCTGPELALAAQVAGPALSGVGTLYKMSEDRRAQRRQEQASIANLLNQRQAQDRADAAVAQQIQQFQPEVRDERQAAIETDLGQRYQAALSGAEEAAPRTAHEVAGNVSGDYLAAAGRAKASQLARGSKLASLLASIDAPGYRAQQEGWMQSDFANQLGQIARGSQVQNQIGNMRIAEAGQVNPRGALIGGLLQAGGGLVAQNGPEWFGGTGYDIANTPSQGVGAGAFLGVPGYSGVAVKRLT